MQLSELFEAHKSLFYFTFTAAVWEA